MGGMKEVKEGGREGGRGKRERWRDGEEFRMYKSLIHKVLVTVNYVNPPF